MCTSGLDLLGRETTGTMRMNRRRTGIEMTKMRVRRTVWDEN